MEVTVLGCRAGMPADGQASSGYLVNASDQRILLDCGPGVATALSAAGGASTLNAVVITHLHSDHCYDVLPIGKMLLQGWLAEADGIKPAPVPLFVPAGAPAVFDRLAALFPVRTQPLLDQAFGVAFAVTVYEPGRPVELGPLRLTWHELRHVAANCGVRVDGPTGSLAYTGDTGPTDALPAMAAGVDLLLAEATLDRPDPGPHGHLSGDDAGRAAAQAGAARLVLTHFASADPAWTGARRADAAVHFAGPIDLAAPGRTFRTDSTVD